jgi:hypothetical protein
MKITKEKKLFLDKAVKGTWSINQNTGLVDVYGIVDMSRINLTEIPVKFGKVTDDFHCFYNKLTSLEGVPKSVMGSFDCSYNQLVNLEGAPKSVCGHFDCSNNQLTSLLGCPQSVGIDFICYNNQLNSLLNSPKSVGGYFYCSGNQLFSFEGFPESLGGLFHIDLSYIKQEYYHLIIPEIEKLLYKGIKLYEPFKYYYPYREIHYKNKLIELL